MTNNQKRILFALIIETIILIYFSYNLYIEKIYRTIFIIILIFSVPIYLYIRKEIETLGISIAITSSIFTVLSFIFVPIAMNKQDSREFKINQFMQEIENLLEMGKTNDALVSINEFRKKNPRSVEKIHKLTKRIELVTEKNKCIENIYLRINKPYNAETLVNLLNDLIKIEKDLEIFPSKELKAIFLEVKDYIIKEIKLELSKSINSQLVESEYNDSLFRTSLSYLKEDIKLLKNLDPENSNLKLFDSKYKLKGNNYDRILENNSFACVKTRYKQGCEVSCSNKLKRECQDPLQAFFYGLKCNNSTIDEIIRNRCTN